MVDQNNDLNQVFMDETDIQSAILKICRVIVEKENNLKNLAFVGIKTRGEFLAKRFRREIENMTGLKSDFGTLDITLYRDDFDTLGDLTVGETDLLFDVAGKRIILVDDVLYTGRTIRAALDQIVDFGRPAEIELAVLVDRGGRELPISANYVGQTISIGADEYIQVQLKEIDDKDQVVALKNE